MKDKLMTVPALSMEYQAMVAAAAAKMKYDDILNLSGPDFMAACLKAQNFFTAQGAVENIRIVGYEACQVHKNADWMVPGTTNRRFSCLDSSYE